MSLVAERIAQRIHREGPIPFDAFVEEALYGDGGFFTGPHGAGRAGRDFVTSPEVGPLFGAMVGRALDRYWDELGARDPFLVIEPGAGRGRLAADVLASEPRCSPALRYVLVERSDARRAEQRDLLALEPVEEDLVRAAPELAVEADHVAPGSVPVGARLPVPTGAREWLQSCAFVLRRGVLIVVDYAATAAELVERGERGWLRTYRQHERGVSPLVAPGEQDITADVPLEYLVHAARRAGLALERECTQAEWLRDLGVDDLVADARAQWDARAHVGDLEALRHRSRVTEAAALLDPAGLGAHRVLVFRAR